MLEMVNSEVILSSFEATFIGPPYPARLIKMPKRRVPPWKNHKKISRYALYKKILPEFIKIIDLSLQESLDNIPIPKRFDKIEIYSLLFKHLTDYLESDVSFKGFIEAFEKTDIYSNPRTYVRTLNRFSNEVDSLTEQLINDLSQNALISNIPFDVFGELSLAFETYRKVFSFITRLSKSKLDKIFLRGFRPSTINWRIKDYFQELSFIMKPYSKVVKKQFELVLYLQVSNSINYDDLFKFKALLKENMDYDAFTDMYYDFKNDLSVLRKVLFEKSPEMFETAIDNNCATAVMWKGIINNI
jgi:hypothetical protein